MAAPFNTFKLSLGVLRFAGFFPFRKVKDTDESSERLVSIGWKVQLLQYVFCASIFNGPIFVILSYLTYISKLASNPLDCFIEIFKEATGTRNSTIDLATMTCLLSLNFIIHYSLMIGSLRSKNKLCELHNFMAIYGSMDWINLDKDTRHGRKHVHHLEFLFLLVSGIWTAGFSWQIVNNEILIENE